MTERFTTLWVRASRLHYRLLYAAMARRGLPLGSPALLRFLSQNDGCRHKDLAENCYLEPATVTSALFTMEKDGLILRQADASDRRSIRIWLTDKGRAALERIGEIQDEMEGICLTGFSQEEKEQLTGLLKKLRVNMMKAIEEQQARGKSRC